MREPIRFMAWLALGVSVLVHWALISQWADPKAAFREKAPAPSQSITARITSVMPRTAPDQPGWSVPMPSKAVEQAAAKPRKAPASVRDAVPADATMLQAAPASDQRGLSGEAMTASEAPPPGASSPASTKA